MRPYLVQVEVRHLPRPVRRLQVVYKIRLSLGQQRVRVELLFALRLVPIQYLVPIAETIRFSDDLDQRVEIRMRSLTVPNLLEHQRFGTLVFELVGFHGFVIQTILRLHILHSSSDFQVLSFDMLRLMLVTHTVERLWTLVLSVAELVMSVCVLDALENFEIGLVVQEVDLGYSPFVPQLFQSLDPSNLLYPIRMLILP